MSTTDAAPSSRRRVVLPAGWPLMVAIAGYPAWWAMGVSAFAFPIVAVPMAWQLLRRGNVRVPPGFWLWALFLLWVLGSAVALDLEAPGTLAPEGTGRYIAYGFRWLNYVSITVMMLYIGNLPESVLSRLRVVRSLGILAVFTIGLGCLAVAFPNFGFDTPIGKVLPASLADSLSAGSLTRVELAQVQPVLGVSSPRPAAPYPYANAWGNNTSLLLVWFVVGWFVVAGRLRKMAAVAILVLALIPVVYSLNRAMWIGIGLSVLYVSIRLAARGRLMSIAFIAATIGLGAAVFVATPLQTMVAQRISNGHSNDVRAGLAGDAIRAAAASPILGFGTTRATEGSEQSIAVGKQPDCPKCGNRNIGSTGHIWLLLIAQGFVGTALYVGFFLRSLWAYRRDSSPIGIAGTLTILLSIFYSFFYSALLMPLAIVFCAIGLLWRNAEIRAAEAAQAAEEDARRIEQTMRAAAQAAVLAPAGAGRPATDRVIPPQPAAAPGAR